MKSSQSKFPTPVVVPDSSFLHLGDHSPNQRPHIVHICFGAACGPSLCSQHSRSSRLTPQVGKFPKVQQWLYYCARTNTQLLQMWFGKFSHSPISCSQLWSSPILFCPSRDRITTKIALPSPSPTNTSRLMMVETAATQTKPAVALV